MRYENISYSTQNTVRTQHMLSFLLFLLVFIFFMGKTRGLVPNSLPWALWLEKKTTHIILHKFSLRASRKLLAHSWQRMNLEFLLVSCPQMSFGRPFTWCVYEVAGRWGCGFSCGNKIFWLSNAICFMWASILCLWPPFTCFNRLTIHYFILVIWWLHLAFILWHLFDVIHFRGAQVKSGNIFQLLPG